MSFKNWSFYLKVALPTKLPTPVAILPQYVRTSRYQTTKPEKIRFHLQHIILRIVRSQNDGVLTR